MGKLFESGAGLLFAAVFLLGQFPGGTILMAMTCNSRRLDGWDWVLSVIVPFYGVMKVLFSRYC
jgi:hypothetical protein